MYLRKLGSHSRFDSSCRGAVRRDLYRRRNVRGTVTDGTGRYNLRTGYGKYGKIWNRIQKVREDLEQDTDRVERLETVNR